ncbi:MAG: shikimate synthase [Bdellovibrionaceae bacterium]|nr:shikimate synthase [Pseudobdellovibrionaceae bacterium]
MPEKKPCITLVIGHRGVGKTAWLERAKAYFTEAGRPFQGFDLDAEIEARSGRRISEIFTTEGEMGFRSLESSTLQSLVSDIESRKQWKLSSVAASEIYIVCGAGFLGPIPPGVRCLWLRRSTDLGGRVFANRPRLDPKVTALEEYLARVDERQARYRRWADETWFMTEGYAGPNESERAFFTDRIQHLGGALTLLPENFRNELQWRVFAEKRSRWGVRYFELRDDLLTLEQVDAARKALPAERLLFSFRDARSPARVGGDAAVRSGAKWDWALELGTPRSVASTLGIPTIVSLHERRSGENFAQALQRLTEEGSTAHLKAALETSDWIELAQGHRWMLENPSGRSFLPRSSDGRWSWYRLWQKNRMHLNFFREGDGSGQDQPTLMDWLSVPVEHASGFAAILGDPVMHSWTCAEQAEFFARERMPVLRIRIQESEWQDSALEFLRELGLRSAAVTAPLKKLAFAACARKSETAQRFQAVNTLQWDEQTRTWSGHNTDVAGFSALLDEADKKASLSESIRSARCRSVIWGGGGTLSLLKSALPHAVPYSVRTALPRETDASVSSASRNEPEVLVWAVGRDPLYASPPNAWRPRLVIDLNYAENSPGLEYALAVGAIYISGVTMFLCQAAEQRKFWGAYVGK